jgi:hypothetical protein
MRGWIYQQNLTESMIIIAEIIFFLNEIYFLCVKNWFACIDNLNEINKQVYFEQSILIVWRRHRIIEPKERMALMLRSENPLKFKYDGFASLFHNANSKEYT